MGVAPIIPTQSIGWRTFDADRINVVFNDPSIRPYVGGDPAEPLDLSEAVANDNNLFLAGEHGALACCWSAPATYEIHTGVLPSGRGEWAFSFTTWAKEYLADHGARHLWTMVEPKAANVRTFTLKNGFSPAGQRTVDLGAGPVTYDIFDWKTPCPLPVQ